MTLKYNCDISHFKSSENIFDIMIEKELFNYRSHQGNESGKNNT